MNKSWCNIRVPMNEEDSIPDSVNYCFVADGVVIANFHVREEFRTAGYVDIMSPKWGHIIEAFESSPMIIKTQLPIRIGSTWDGAEFTDPGEPIPEDLPQV